MMVLKAYRKISVFVGKYPRFLNNILSHRIVIYHNDIITKEKTSFFKFIDYFIKKINSLKSVCIKRLKQYYIDVIRIQSVVSTDKFFKFTQVKYFLNKSTVLMMFYSDEILIAMSVCLYRY